VRRALRKLRLRQGDIVVVETGETAKRIIAAFRLIKTNKDIINIPIVIAPEGVHCMTVKQLKKILKLATRHETFSRDVETFLGGNND
jgi:hypothetical protein